MACGSGGRPIRAPGRREALADVSEQGRLAAQSRVRRDTTVQCDEEERIRVLGQKTLAEALGGVKRKLGLNERGDEG